MTNWFNPAMSSTDIIEEDKINPYYSPTLLNHTLSCRNKMRAPPHCLLPNTVTRSQDFRRFCRRVVFLESVSKKQTVVYHSQICFNEQWMKENLDPTRTFYCRSRSDRHWIILLSPRRRRHRRTVTSGGCWRVSAGRFFLTCSNTSTQSDGTHLYS